MASEVKIKYVKNPYPGIRSFREEESDLFFGREKQINELLEILQTSNFVAITGASGSGKSSLIKAGVIPKLKKENQHWSSIVFRPGNSLFFSMSEAFQDLFINENISLKTLRNPKEIEDLLKKGVRDFVSILKQVNYNKNLLVYIDQFEEIFRFRQNEYIAQAKAESDFFVKLIIDLAHCKEHKFSVIISLRADFLSDCTEFADFPNIINQGHYLIPRMTVDEQKRAILGPANIAGAEFSEVLLAEITEQITKNDVSLPILQHALMRTWDYWLLNSEGNNVIELEHYTAVGTISDALSVHAEFIYEQLHDDALQKITEKIFKALTFLGDDNRATRRPTSLGDICSITVSKEEDVIEVINVFRAEGNSFLFPPESVRLNSSVIIDISHESIMRIWKRLIDWVREETESAQIYLRISNSAELYQIGKSGLLSGPDLLLALKWFEDNSPNQTWAKRYNPAYDRAINYLNFSKEEDERVIGVKERKQHQSLRRTRIFVIILAAASIISILFLVVALNLQYKAEASEKKAKEKEKIAISESKLAEEKRKEAISQGKIAQQQRFIAEEQKLLADAQKLIAVTQQNEAIRQKGLALLAEKEALNSRDAAFRSKKEAEKMRDQAVKNEKIALEQKLRAEFSEAKTDTMRRLAIAKALAVNAIKLKESQSEIFQLTEQERELPMILALQAYYFNSNFGGDPNSPEIFNALADVANLSIHLKGKISHNEAVRAVAISPDGVNFVTSSDDGSVKMFSLKSLDAPQNLKTPLLSKVIYRSLLFGGNDIIIGGTNKGDVVIWNKNNLSEKPTILNLHSGVVTQILSNSSFSTYYSLSLDGTVKSWNTSNLLSVKTVHKATERINSMALTSNGEILVLGTVSGELIYLNTFDFSEKKRVNTGKGEITSLCFTTGDELAVGFYSGIIEILGNKPVNEFLAHQSGVTALLYDESRKRLISASYDGLIKVWNAADFELIPPLVIDKHDSWVYALGFINEKKNIISVSADKSILITAINITDLKNFVRSKVSKNMSEKNWLKFVGEGIKYDENLPK